MFSVFLVMLCLFNIRTLEGVQAISVYFPHLALWYTPWDFATIDGFSHV